MALGVNRWRRCGRSPCTLREPGDHRRACSPRLGRWARRSCSRWSRARWAFAPNPVDGLTFILEPLRTLAATIVDNAEGLSVKPFGQTIYAIAARVLLLSSFFLSFATAGAAKQPMKNYGVRV